MSRLQPTLYLSFEVTKVLAEMEKNGIKINRQSLETVKQEYTAEANELEKFLNQEIARVMGEWLKREKMAHGVKQDIYVKLVMV